MQFDTEFLEAQHVLVVHVHGGGDSTTALQFVAAVKAAPAFRPGTAILIDGIDSEYLPSSGEARSYPDLIESELPGSRLAFVPRDDAAFGVGRMIATLAECQGVSFAVFRRRDDAMRWLTQEGTTVG